MRELMNVWLKELSEAAKNRDGTVAVEYAMIAGTVSLAIIFALGDIRSSLGIMYNSFASFF